MGLAARLSLWLHARLSARRHTYNATWNKNFQRRPKPLKTYFLKNPVRAPSPTDSYSSAVINPDSTFN